MNLHLFWYQKWKEHISAAKRFPDQADIYCHMAALAQTQYLCYSAIYWQGVKP